MLCVSVSDGMFCGLVLASCPFRSLGEFDMYQNRLVLKEFLMNSRTVQESMFQVVVLWWCQSRRRMLN